MTAEEYVRRVVRKDLQGQGSGAHRAARAGLLGARRAQGLPAVGHRVARLRGVHGVAQSRAPPRGRAAPVRNVRVAAVQYQMRPITSFERVRAAVRVLHRHRLRVPRGLPAVPRDAHQPAPGPGAGARVVGDRAPARRVHAALRRVLHEDGDEVQRQHHRRHAPHRRERQALQHRVAVPPRRLGREAVQAAHLAVGAALVGRVGAATRCACSTPIAARSRS